MLPSLTSDILYHPKTDGAIWSEWWDEIIFPQYKYVFVVEIW